MKDQYSIDELCLALAVSRSGFYAWRNHRPSRRTQDDTHFAGKIIVAHARSLRTYGSPRIRLDLHAEGLPIGRRRIARIMHQQKISGRSRKRRSPQTTNSQHDHPVAPNLLKDHGPAQAVNKIWRTDITYVPTDEGWLYVAAIMDAYSRKIVGWAFGSTLATSLCLDALNMALQTRGPSPDLIHHSDRGVQYASHEYRQALQRAGLIPSMSRKANCYDNAMVESFWSTLKIECVFRNHFKTRAQARLAVFDFIECFYNPRRRHSSIGYLSPVDFEALNN